MDSILIVDDEKNILLAFKRSFFDLPFNIFTANSAKEALNIMENNDIDIVISDYKMPKMNGLELLKKIKKKHPEAFRIILSGFIKKSIMIKSITTGNAINYITKPWDDNDLKKLLQHLLEIKNLINDKSLLKKLNSIDNLPSLPAIYSKLLELIGGKAPAKKITKLLKHDEAIAAKILHIANSAFYGNRKIGSLQQAIVRIGINALKDIVMYISLKNNLNISSNFYKYLEEIYKEATIANRYLNIFYKSKYNKSINNEASSIGLLYNIGKVLMLSLFEDDYIKIKKYQENNNMLYFYKVEKILDINIKHNILSGYFLNLWNFSELIIDSGLYYFQPEKAREKHKKYLYLLEKTNKLISVLKFDKLSTDFYEKYFENILSKNEFKKITNKIRKELKND